MVFKKKQSAVDEQIAEIDKLNAVINAAERDMLKLRKVWLVCIGLSAFRVVGYWAGGAHGGLYCLKCRHHSLRYAIPFCSR